MNLETALERQKQYQTGMIPLEENQDPQHGVGKQPEQLFSLHERDTTERFNQLFDRYHTLVFYHDKMTGTLIGRNPNSPLTILNFEVNEELEIQLQANLGASIYEVETGTRSLFVEWKDKDTGSSLSTEAMIAINNDWLLSVGGGAPSTTLDDMEASLDVAEAVVILSQLRAGHPLSGELTQIADKPGVRDNLEKLDVTSPERDHEEDDISATDELPRGLDTSEINQDEHFQSLIALHSLQRIVADLDTLRRDEILEHLSAILMPDYEAPDGMVIELIPDHPTSREVAPYLQQFLSSKNPAITPGWYDVAPESDFYEENVARSRWGDMSSFRGKRLHQGIDGTIYVVSEGGTVRARADRHMKIVQRKS